MVQHPQPKNRGAEEPLPLFLAISTIIRIIPTTIAKNAKIPQKAHDDDFCYDVWAVSEEEVAPNVWKYGLGFALEITENEIQTTDDVKFVNGITIRPRSSIWKTGMIMSNSLGTVDYGYRGEMSAVFYHVMPNMPRYKVGDKIAQLHLDWSEDIEFNEVDELDDSERGDGGYGSTGTK